jgi:hypothetical protein
MEKELDQDSTKAVQRKTGVHFLPSQYTRNTFTSLARAIPCRSPSVKTSAAESRQ